MSCRCVATIFLTWTQTSKIEIQTSAVEVVIRPCLFFSGNSKKVIATLHGGGAGTSRRQIYILSSLHNPISQATIYFTALHSKMISEGWTLDRLHSQLIILIMNVGTKNNELIALTLQQL